MAAVFNLGKECVELALV